MYLLILLVSIFNPESKIKKPPGTVQIEKNLYFDRTEITHRDWKGYHYFKRADLTGSSERMMESLRQLMDTTTFRLKGSEEIKVHPRYNSYPVTKISYEEAVAYCEWRTRFLNFSHYGDKNYKVVYRLPTKEEFSKAVAFEKKAFAKRMEKVQQSIEKHNNREERPTISVGKFVDLDKYWKRKMLPGKIQGLFHNAAEMSATKGIAYGMTNETMSLTGDFMQETRYDGPSEIVGFRCVAEFIFEDN